MKPMLIHNARVFCGVDEEVIDDGTVWVANGFIRYAGPSVDFHHDGTDVEVYDAEGQVRDARYDGITCASFL